MQPTAALTDHSKPRTLQGGHAHQPPSCMSFTGDPRREHDRRGIPDYLARNGVPHSPADLHAHACINWRLQGDGRVYRWEFDKKGKRLEVAVEGPLITSQADVGAAAALQGLGILYAFDHDHIGAALAQGRLVQILALPSQVHG